MTKKVLVFITVCVLVVLLCACGSKQDEFRVGMECDYAPFNWTQSEPTEYTVPIQGGGYADGYDVQIAKMVADKLGKKLVIIKTEWDGLTLSLNSGNIDAIIAGMSPTEERKATVDFTASYLNLTAGVLVRSDSKYAEASSINDFAGARISGQLNTIYYDMIDEMSGVEKAEAMESIPVVTVALKSGAIDGFIMDFIGAESIILANPEFKYISFSKENGFSEYIETSIGLRKNDENYDVINSVVEALDDQTQYQMARDAIARQPLGN